MSSPSPRATVVIPNWNGAAHLPECLGSLLGQTERSFETIVVDNASTDGSLEWLRAHAPWVRVIPRGDNGGFAAAVNEGIRVASGECIVLLNNDTVPDVRWLEELLDALDDTAFDFAASCMVMYDSPQIVNAAGDVFNMLALAGLNRGADQAVGRYGKPVRVLNASAGAAAYRRSFFDDVGLFDEDFFLLSEDTDLGLRALIAGKRCVYVPTAVVRHKLGASIHLRPNWDTWRMSAHNVAMVVGKDFPAVLLPLAALMWPVRTLTALPCLPWHWHQMPERLAHMPDRLRAEIEGLRLGWRKRDEVWTRQAVPTMTVVRWLFSGTGKVRSA